MARPSSSSASAGSDRRSKKASKEGHIPRPPNEFIIFRKAWLEANKAANSEQATPQRVLSAVIGKAWRASPEHVKDVYRDLAKLAKEDHKLKYPNYVFRPRQKPKFKNALPEPEEEPSPIKELAGTTVETSVHWQPIEVPPPRGGDEVLEMSSSKDVPSGEEDADEQLQGAFLDHESPSDSESITGDEVLLRPVEELYRVRSLGPVESVDPSPASYVGSVNPYPCPSPQDNDIAVADMVALLSAPGLGPVDQCSEFVDLAYGTSSPSQRDDDNAFAELEDLFIQYEQLDQQY
ncbi:hypothetical protein C8T65DRAFT_694932 [Cerioporus squamosus]|nr:hypothetical protein C8T65DRAFT_694932 [Cerioporus squamosus]